MGADADFLSMAGSIFRTCYITFTCLICDLYLIERIFLRRRKRTALILYYVMKTLALNIIMGMVLDPFSREYMVGYHLHYSSVCQYSNQLSCALLYIQRTDYQAYSGVLYCGGYCILSGDAFSDYSQSD